MKELIKRLREQGFNKKIVNAFASVDRADFVSSDFKGSAYKDIALPISEGQTISQPFTIAFMLSLFNISGKKKIKRILEVGSGSGYVLALLSKLCPESEIYGIERIKKLADKSARRLESCRNVRVIHGNGSKGFREKSPFDRILVSAECKEIPHKLVNQLKFKGILVAPVGKSIVCIKKESGENKIDEYPGFSFVPLID